MICQILGPYLLFMLYFHMKIPRSFRNASHTSRSFVNPINPSVCSVLLGLAIHRRLIFQVHSGQKFLHKQAQNSSFILLLVDEPTRVRFSDPSAPHHTPAPPCPIEIHPPDSSFSTCCVIFAGSHWPLYRDRVEDVCRMHSSCVVDEETSLFLVYVLVHHACTGNRSIWVFLPIHACCFMPRRIPSGIITFSGSQHPTCVLTFLTVQTWQVIAAFSFFNSW